MTTRSAGDRPRAGDQEESCTGTTCLGAQAEPGHQGLLSSGGHSGLGVRGRGPDLTEGQTGCAAEERRLTALDVHFMLEQELPHRDCGVDTVLSDSPLIQVGARDWPWGF